MSTEPDKPLPPDDDPDGQREWRALRGTVRHQTVGMLGEIFALLRILLQDAIILVVGFAIEFAFEHWLHSEQPFFKLAINISSAVFLLLYLVMVTVHVIHYVREQFGVTAANITGNWLPWGLAAAGVIAAVVTFNRIGFQQTESGGNGAREVSRVTIPLPPGQQFGNLGGTAIAISPDGKHIVYSTGIKDGPLLTAMQGLSITALDQRMFIRSLDSEEVRPIATDGGGMMPFFSPDGKWVGVLSRSGISKLPIEGGPTTKILQTTLLAGASWNADGNLLYQKGIAGNLGLLLREGEPVREFGTLDPGEVMLRWPEFLPDGKSFLTAASRSNVAWSDAQISLQSIANPGRKNLVQGTQPRYSPTGHLIFGREGKLFAAPFDAVAGELKGEPVMVQDGVLYDDQTGSVQYSFSNTGTLIYLNGGSVASKSNLEWVSRAGVSEPLRSATHNYIFPRLSPDGNKIAVTIAEPDSQIWIHEIARGTLSKLTLEGTLNRSPAWSHDGRRVAFYSSRAGPLNLFWQLADGSGTAERLTTTDEPAVTQSPSAFSPGDEYLAFSRISQEGRDIMMLSLRDRKITTFLKTPFEDTAPVFSPDGKWIAYSSDESGRREIYVQPFPGPGAKFQVSTEGGMEPVWNPRGGELFYRNGRKSMVVPVSTQYSFSAGNPKLLFESSHLVTPSTYANYDVTPDGQRFLMLRQAESESEALTQINVVLNWFEELKQKVPVQ